MKVTNATSKTIVTIPGGTWDKQSPFDQFDREIVFKNGAKYALIFFATRQSTNANPYKTFRSEREMKKAFYQERGDYHVEIIDRNGNSLWIMGGELALDPCDHPFPVKQFDCETSV